VGPEIRVTVVVVGSTSPEPVQIGPAADMVGAGREPLPAAAVAVGVFDDVEAGLERMFTVQPTKPRRASCCRVKAVACGLLKQLELSPLR
jgi:hypothetical protein